MRIILIEDSETESSREPDVVAVVRTRLHQQGVRLTGGRDRLVRALWRAPGPRTAAELSRQLRARVPLSSLYRSLGVLEAGGVITRSHDPGGLVRYELAEWLRGHHHHIACVVCGRVQDVELDEASERALRELAGRLARGVGYLVAGHGLEIEGTCGGCAG